MKPMTDESAAMETRKSAQQTLYTCLDYGLRLLHPFMPFVNCDGGVVAAPAATT